MDILVVGNGGREHALCWKIAQSPKCNKLFCAPGNAGIENLAECVNIQPNEISDLVNFAKNNLIDLVIVGPEIPLVMGLVDKLELEGISAFGPNQAAAKLEGSKAFMKDLFTKYNIPTAKYSKFTNFNDAVSYIKSQGFPIVLKASGLAAGKGVIIAQTKTEAIIGLDEMMNQNKFGKAGQEVVIEEFLTGEEASFFVLVDGKTALPLLSAQDHKTAYDGDKGPNTGGMGAYSPAPIITKDIEEKIMSSIIKPIIDGMTNEGCPYKGILFAGLMIKDGEPKTLEFNVRFGDPECQTLMRLLDSDLVEALDATVSGNLDKIQLNWKNEMSIIVVMAAKGYPGSYSIGTTINNLNEAEQINDAKVFHAGTKKDSNNYISNGGRVLGVTATGKNINECRARSYKAIEAIDWPDGFYRKDIGWRIINN
ncbi:MAG: phosphoribosylamine--glycine ligase [Rhodospirillaceae bacterium]|nr:phosphoribosylamine--glycine ligase [Rhodospirillaceae bacterium]OUT76130.1 MAG: phosphoribosylamine--glycine ligase [Rhodospirillaceae bacterium TMED23]|tara:strand:- start:1560 stop:2831 length:1272 start_codon:yes stop_codon:yes gene_type:complete